MKRLLSLFFMFLFIGTMFTAFPVHAQSSSYILQLYDSQGRYLDPNNPNIYDHAAVKIEKVGFLWRSTIGTYSGRGNVNNITFTTDASRIRVTFFWYGNPVYNTEVPLTDEIVKVQMPITPAIPITTYQTEAVTVSADLHEVKSKFYDVMFGTGTDQNQIKVTAGGNSYIMPVTLALNYNSNSDTKPFRFLAQNPQHPVEGSDKFLIWTTAKYWSSVKTKLVGDNMLLVVWTYGYTNVAGAWRDKVIAAIFAGAVMGALSGPEGALAGGTIAGMATAIAWAVNPELVNLAANTGIGVVVGLFTPRYFQIQGVGGFGANGTKGTVTISDIPASGRQTWQGTSYEIYSESNTLQMGFTKDWGSVHVVANDDFEDDTTDGWTGDVSIQSTTVYAGKYSAEFDSSSSNHPEYLIGSFTAGEHIKISIGGYFEYPSATSGMYAWLVYGNGTAISGTTKNFGTATSWKHLTWTYYITLTSNTTVSLVLSINSGQGNLYFDNIQIEWYNASYYRYIFDTSQTGGSGVVRYMFGTIPVIAPSSQGGVPIQNRYTLIAIDMAKQDGALALDWASRVVTLSPARLLIKTDTWTETAWLLGTDDRDGFKNVNFTIVNPKWFVYRVDFMTYYMFTTPDNWTVTENWSPLMANNTTIYIPNWYPGGWDVMNYNLHAWWNNLPLWWKGFVMLLPLLIIGLILLIIAPWVIVALIKGIAMIFKGIGKGVSMVGKAFSGRKRGR